MGKTILEGNMASLSDLIQQNIALREQEISGQEAQLAKLQNQPKKMDLTPLAMLVDTVTGSKDRGLSKMAMAMKPKDNSVKLNALRQQLLQQKQGLTGDQIKLLTALGKNKADAKKSGKILTSSAVNELSDVETQYNTADSIMKDWQESVGDQRGDLGRVGSWGSGFIPGSSEDIYGDRRKLQAQTIGKALEGGKLTDVDYEKYLKFIPGLGDTKEQAESKIKSLKNAMANKYNTSVDSYQKAGFSTGDLGTLDVSGESNEQETKEWNGKVYKKVGNKWVQQ